MVGLTNQLSAFKLYVMLFLWLVNGFWLWTAPRLQCWHFETKGVLNMCENTHSFFLFAYFFGSVIGSGEGLGRKPSEFTSRRHGPRKGQSSASSALWALVAVGWLQIDLAQRTHPRPRTPTPKNAACRPQKRLQKHPQKICVSTQKVFPQTVPKNCPKNFPKNMCVKTPRLCVKKIGAKIGENIGDDLLCFWGRYWGRYWSRYWDRFGAVIGAAIGKTCFGGEGFRSCLRQLLGRNIGPPWQDYGD